MHKLNWLPIASKETTLQPIPKIIAHRGASAYAPENTFAAFNKALALNCPYLEFDVMLSEEGEPYVFHDEDLSRTSNGEGEFGFSRTDYLNKLDAGSWFSATFKGEKIPHLKDVIEWLVFHKVQANIEIKPYPGKTIETTQTVIHFLENYWSKTVAWPLISSFDLEALSLAQQLNPNIPRGLLLDSWENSWLITARKLSCWSIHLNKWALTASRASQIKKEGFYLFVYTVNTLRQAKKLFSWGVDSIFSDYPDLLV